MSTDHPLGSIRGHEAEMLAGFDRLDVKVAAIDQKLDVIAEHFAAWDLQKTYEVRIDPGELEPAAGGALAVASLEISALRGALQRIAELDPEKDSEEGRNEWGEAECFDRAQEIARHVLLVTAPPRPTVNNRQE